jgi:cytochrome b561
VTERYSTPLAAPSPELAPGGIGRLHQVGGNLLLILAGLHGCAALWHQFILKDNILKRISPF